MCQTSAGIKMDDQISVEEARGFCLGERWPPFKDTCMDCKWWFPVTPFLDDISDTGGGECRYGPPTVISSYGSSMSDCKFPVMSEYDWCGRFERRTPADEELHRRLYEKAQRKTKWQDEAK